MSLREKNAQLNKKIRPLLELLRKNLLRLSKKYAISDFLQLLFLFSMFLMNNDFGKGKFVIPHSCNQYANRWSSLTECGLPDSAYMNA